MEAAAAKATFKKYPAYKDSGVEWLGEIPEHWQAIKMKYLFRDVSEKNKPEAELLSVTQDQGVVPRTWVENRMVMPSGNLESFKFIQKGDFAISLRSFEGGLEYCHHEGIISPAYTVLKKRKGLIDGYYKYLFKSKSFISEIQTSVVGIREGKNISYFELSYSLMPIPSPEEQTAIATYLDDKTAKIDRAIAQKEKMIALLKERKQIIIQNAVTKGLDPNAKMKHSGVEWIGEIPEGWEVKRLKFVAKININSLPENTPRLFSFNYVDIGSVSFENGIERTEYFEFKNAPSRARRITKRGNTVISTVRTYLKAIDYISEDKAGFIYSTGFAVLEPIGLVNEFLYHFVRSNAFTEQVTVDSKGMSYPAINSTDLSRLFLAIPPIQDQTAIVTHIETQSSKIDKAIKLQEQQIEKLKELKSTLIENAVTGKIKVS